MERWRKRCWSGVGFRQTETMNRKFDYLLLVISIVFFVISLTQFVFICKDHSISLRGYQVLIMGWLGIAGFDPRWFANCSLFYLWRCILAEPKKAFPKKTILFVGATVISLFVVPGRVACQGAAWTLDAGGFFWVQRGYNAINKIRNS